MKCKECGADAVKITRGMCQPCYMRWRRGVGREMIGNWHKITKEDEEEIMKMSARYTQRAIAERYNVSLPTIQNVFRKHGWYDR